VTAPARLAVAALASSTLAGCSWPLHSYESLGSEVDAQVARAIEREHLPPSAVPGAYLFARSGCTACHTYAGLGTPNLGARELGGIGKGQTASFFARYIADPRKFGNRVMPVYGDAFSKTQLAELGAFLAASKGVG
jgi:mono/diheme cytochrome c family protein